jgi:low affinity Fe/Cu permease
MVKRTQETKIEKLAFTFTESVGSITSIVVHTIGFIAIFALGFFGVKLDSILLILTTAVSLEAIYLAIFIQMSVNRNTQSLQEVEEDIEEIQEDIEEMEEEEEK